MDCINEFADNHPVWFWLIVRLLIADCWVFAAIAALIALAVVVAPLGGARIVIWVFAPILIAACWCLVEFALWLFKEFVED
jgi:hypothetical protein